MSHHSTASVILRILWTALVAAGLWQALRASYNIYRADRIGGREPTLEGFSRALEYDRLDSTLWWRRGRIHHYDAASTGVESAIADYREALSLNPRLAQGWIDLADCYERTGRPELADDALAKAAAARPFSAVTHWQIGNHYLRRGNHEAMTLHFRRAVDLDMSKLGIALETARKLNPNPEQVLRVLPAHTEAEFEGLAFALNNNDIELARAVWGRIAAGQVPAGSFRTALVFTFVDRLLAHSQAGEARRVWEKALAMAGRPASRADADDAVWNGSFESDPLGGGFDWRWKDSEAVRIRIVSDGAAEGLRCLRIEFGGGNISFANISQVVPLPAPGDYELEFHVRTSGLSSDQKPYVSAGAFPHSGRLNVSSSQFESESGWHRVRLPFTAPPGCTAVQIQVRRERSQKFDNRLNGTVWLDGFVLRPLSGAEAGTRRITNP
jgi:hypothetical protein